MKGMRGMTAVVMALATSSAATYQVGGSSRWTILGNVNYADWAGKQTFKVGDVIGLLKEDDRGRFQAGVRKMVRVVAIVADRSSIRDMPRLNDGAGMMADRFL